MKNKKVKEILEAVAVEDIKPYARNPRKNDGIPVDEVVKSIKKVGYRTPIIVDEKNIILVGHTRLKAIKAMGWAKIPFVIRFNDLTPEQKKEYRVMDNKTGEFAEWDFDLLTKDFSQEDLNAMGFNMSSANYGDKNQEVNVDEFSDRLTIVLEYTEDDYKKVIQQLAKIANTPEQAVWKLLGNE